MVVIILIGILSTLVVANSLTLRHLREDLRRIEHRQQERWKKKKETDRPLEQSPQTLKDVRPGRIPHYDVARCHCQPVHWRAS